jgi:hypothetical protein
VLFGKVSFSLDFFSGLCKEFTFLSALNSRLLSTTGSWFGSGIACIFLVFPQACENV